LGATYLGFEAKTTNGTITVLEDCNYIVALVTGSIQPPVINALEMTTKATVSAQGVNKAISLHVLPIDVWYEYSFIMYGDSVTFIYIQNGVCTRPDIISGYSATGTVSGTLPSSTDDLLVGLVIGNNGQVTITADTVALTFPVDTVTSRVGYKTPGDTSQAISATDPGTLTGYWYQPPAVWVDTTTSVLISPGHYSSGGLDYYDIFIDGVKTGRTGIPSGYNPPPTEIWYTYAPVWFPPVYEEQASGYWSYPAQQWIETGVAGYVSAIVASIADVMIGADYISRPIVF
jgi:hypothetical protein